MKKTLSLLLSLFLLCSVPLPTFASTLLPGMNTTALSSGESYSYEDTDTGCCLTIPGDWEQKSVTGDPVAKAEFTHSEEDSAVIRYGSADMWSTQSAAMQKKISREEFDNEMYSEEDIAELVGTKEKYVEITTLEGTEFFQAEVGKRRFFSFKVTDTYLIRVDNGWMYIYAFSGSDKHDLYDSFEAVVSSSLSSAPVETIETTTQPVATTEPADTEFDTYLEAIAKYQDGLYATAKELFESLDGYSESEAYLRLIRIRSYGSNTGMGCVYYHDRGLTQEQKEDIDKAAETFYLADTDEVLLCNSDVACYYLLGDWITASNSPAYSYLKFKKDASGGYCYYRSSNLSTMVSDCFSIEDGTVRISITSSNTLTFELELTAPDCLEVYSYEKCTTTTLYRGS